MALTLGWCIHSLLSFTCVAHFSAAVGGPATPPRLLELPIQYPSGSPMVCPMTQIRAPSDKRYWRGGRAVGRWGGGVVWWGGGAVVWWYGGTVGCGGRAVEGWGGGWY